MGFDSRIIIIMEKPEEQVSMSSEMPGVIWAVLVSALKLLIIIYNRLRCYITCQF